MATASGQTAMMGTYELARRLGVGGMGEVWLARQRGAAGFSRDVAVKRLLPQAMEQPDVVKMFIEEAQLTARLRHPNVVNVIELGAAESGELYLVLEYVDGTGLHKLLREPDTRPSIAGALVITRDIALALDSAHNLTDEEGKSLGLVHRDVTPSNVMLDRFGHIKLMDFGIAKVRAKQNTTEAGIIKGKLAYLAPEQLRGDVDHRSDLFALGLVLWELLAGRQARDASSDAVLMAKVALDDVPSIRTAVEGLPEAVAAMVDKACATNPDDRYQSGQEMATAALAALDALEDRPRIEAVREQVAACVRKATERDGPAIAGLTNKSQTVDGESLALTIHSLVLQQGDMTLSQPLSPEMIKVRPPPDAKLTSTRGATAAGATSATSARTGTVAGTKVRGKKNSSVLPLVAVVGSLVVVGLAAALKKPRNTAALPSAAPSSASATSAPTATAALTASPSATASAPSATPSASAIASASAARNPRASAGPTRPTTPNARATASLEGGVATLGIVVNPWGVVFLDGRRLGEAPILPHQVPSGRHTVRITNDERQYDRSFTIQLAPNERRIVREDISRGGQ